MQPQNAEPIPLERRSGPLDRRARDTPQKALEELIRLLEYDLPEMHASVLLLQEDGVTLRHGAAPSLPREYTQLIDGSRIGPAAGSCGTAAWRREQVLVDDISSDPLWAEYRDLALPFGLRACWSTPLFDSAGSVLGTFAMYYREPRLPTAHELGMTYTAATLASNILVRARVEESLRQARAEADRANRARGEFLALMGRELRTPLTAIGGYASRMLDGIPEPVSEGQRAYLRRILKAQRHLLGLIDAAVTHAMLESGQMTYEMGDVSLGEVLELVESLTRPQVTAKSMVYEDGACDPSLVLRCDRRKVVQVLVNLVSNAVRFTPAGGRIIVRTAVPGPDRALVGVRDTGIGMTAEQIATIFDPVPRLDERLARGDLGTGLDVPLSRELARGMGGDLTVESRPGEGTEFLLALPTAAAPAD